MNTAEVTVLLTRIQAIDNRQVSDITIQAWEDVIGKVAYVDAVEAVNRHFRTSPDYLKPYHVVEGANAAKRSRQLRMLRTPHEPEWENWYDTQRCTACGREESVHGKRTAIEVMQESWNADEVTIQEIKAGTADAVLAERKSAQ